MLLEPTSEQEHVDFSEASAKLWNMTYCHNQICDCDPQTFILGTSLRAQNSQCWARFARLGRNATVVAAIPAYNEERAIAKVLVHTTKHVDTIVVVDDGSRDDTALIAQKLGAVVIRNKRNFGKGAALRACFHWAQKAQPDVLVTLDADGQHYPDEIPKLVRPILEGKADVVIGSRKLAEEMPTHRRFGAKVLDNVVRVIGTDGEIVDSQSGFRAYSKKAMALVTAAEYGMGVDSEIIMRASHAGLRILEVPISVKYQDLEASTHNPVYHWLDVFFSALKFITIRHPILFYGGFSIAMFAIALVFGTQTLYFYNTEKRVYTNLALMSIASGILGFLALFTGLILFTLITVLRERQSELI